MRKREILKNASRVFLTSTFLLTLLSVSGTPLRADASAAMVTLVLQESTTMIGQPLLFPLFQNQVTALLLEISPGGQTGRHQHPVPIFVYMLEGKLTMEVEGHGQMVWAAGQGFLEDLNNWHNSFNREGSSVKALVVFAAQEGMPTALRPADIREVGIKRTPVFQGTTTISGQPIEFPHFRNQVTAVRAEIPPGGEIGRYAHAVPTFVYILEGTLTMQVEGGPQRVFAGGQSFVGDVNTWQKGVNREPTPVRVLMVSFGEAGKAALVRD